MLEKVKINGYYYGALGYVFLIPFYQKLATLALVLWAVLAIVSVSKTNLNMSWQLLLLPIFYLLYGIGFFTAETPYFGFLETKLSFLIFPLLFFLNDYSVTQRTKMLKIFVFGLFGSALICLSYACYQAIGVEDSVFCFRANVLQGKGFMESILYGGNYFFGKHFSIFHQTIYYALYLCLGVVILFFNPKMFSVKTRWSLLSLFVLLLFLISNKASFIALGTVALFYVLKTNLDLPKKIMTYTFVFAVIAIFVLVNPRAKESISKLANGELVVDKNARFGFATRILSWDAALTLIKEEPLFGYGAGETQLKLNEVYAEKEYKHPLKETYNAHNLWLQTLLENGLIAFLLLAGIFVALFQQSITSSFNQGFYIAIVLLLLINALFESMFNRFSGVSFFSFIVCFILSISVKGGTKK